MPTPNPPPGVGGPAPHQILPMRTEGAADCIRFHIGFCRRQRLQNFDVDVKILPDAQLVGVK